MFKNIYPLFERKRVLKKEMLENIRDYPRDILRIFYQDYSDGILTGCGLEVRDGVLVIRPGIVYFKKIFYVLEEAFEAPYEPTGTTVYVKIDFMDRVRGSEQEEYLSQVVLGGEEADSSHEMELARFKLQHGARLRNAYTDFFDYNTEFDTVNIIHVPYAAPGKSSICPQIMKTFAQELMRHPLQSPWDYPFCMNCLHAYGAMPYEEVRDYLRARTKQDDREYDNGEIYRMLERILKETSGREGANQKADQGGRGLLLI